MQIQAEIGVKTHDNIVSYIQGEYRYDQSPPAIKKALRAWKQILEKFRYAFPYRKPVRSLVFLGGVYDLSTGWIIQLYADKKPRIPHMPSILVIKQGEEVRFLRLRNRKEYTEILKLLIHGSVVVADSDTISMYLPT